MRGKEKEKNRCIIYIDIVVHKYEMNGSRVECKRGEIKSALKRELRIALHMIRQMLSGLDIMKRVQKVGMVLQFGPKERIE